MPATLVIDAFSGLPNPQWALSAEFAGQICEFIRMLPPASPAGGLPPPGLGYRGLILTLPDCEGLPATLRIFGGQVEAGARILADTDRQLERDLLAAARPHLDRRLIDSLLQSIPE
ncbi:hypothetical protein E2A64_14005 [Pseudohoeflea suaedae]|uniref:Uncharacterized protein n=1 Tax=Pseudohoeflea suaedae TaxID=877384 RepID=A0A4R5PI80_9HYPH|nr:hypothetical protein [Pseudohoeflea suaedae]TDH34852.1 hypothetical protein E2A64_14005 [Pseudohoeflea suaedae]